MIESSYGPAELISGAAVCAIDHSGARVSATCWSSSEAWHHAALRWVEERALLRDNISQLLQEMRANRAVDAELLCALSDAIRGEVCDRNTDVRALRELPSAVRLIAFQVDHVVARRATLPRTQEHVSIVIPFRGRPGDGRLRNLLTILRALDQQSSPRDSYSVMVVEQDANPAHRGIIAPFVDKYIFQPSQAAFNKARALNHGVRAAEADSDFVFLDADTWVDSFLVERTRRELASSSGALLPYTDAFFADPQSSDRLRAGAEGGLLGHLVLHPPGGIVAVKRDLCFRAGGFNESYVGWGGEDRDFITRLERLVPISRSPGLMIHLDHERPNMRSSRSRIHEEAGAKR